MARTMITAANTIAQLQRHFEIVSHNIANSETTGFKRREASFSELVFQEINNQPVRSKEIGRLSPHGIRQGVGAFISKSALTLQQGPLKRTDRSLDMAFTEENQFLTVLVQENNETSVQFTRNGALYVTPAGTNELMLVTGDGHPILDEAGNRIVFSDQLNEYIISKNGTFQAKGEDGQAFSVNLGIVTVKKPQFLEQNGDALFGIPRNLDPAADPASIYTQLTGDERSDISIVQGVLESSNVDLSKEMTDIISIQRALQFQSRSITIADQMMGLVNGIR